MVVKGDCLGGMNSEETHALTCGGTDASVLVLPMAPDPAFTNGCLVQVS